MTNLQAYIVATVSIFSLAWFDSVPEDKKEKGNKCKCFEVHEKIERGEVYGKPSKYWVIDFETMPKVMPCAEDSEYKTINKNKRFKIKFI